MANSWLRLWHDMPNDPKWRTIARISGQRIGDVQSVYMHLLTSASQNVTRGHADVTAEDLASALDVTDEDIQSILDAMQGRVLEGMMLTGWEKRQPKREDVGNAESGAKSGAERKRLQREREKAAQESEAANQCHEESRNVTTDKDKDKDKDKEEPNKADKPPSPQKKRFTPPTLDDVSAYCEERGNHVDPEQWFDHYTAKGWMVGKSPMKDWKAAVRTWEKSAAKQQPAATVHQVKKTPEEIELARRYAISAKLLDELGSAGYEAHIAAEERKRRGIA